MRGWDQLLDGYLAQYAARGLSDGSVSRTTSVLGQWGQWMKRCRPRPRIDEIDAPLITRFIRSRGTFKAKSTVSGTLSVMRGMGEFLVREGVCVQPSTQASTQRRHRGAVEGRGSVAW
jgi:site-specific recombinase XerD